MKKLFYSQKFPATTIMELEHEQKMGADILRKELERLILMEQPQVAINQAMDYLRTLPEKPIDQKELLELIMQTDEIYNLLKETSGIMVLAPEEMTEEYNQKTLLSFLEHLMNWEVTK